MKLNGNRETIVGLSLLLALVVTLGVVAARRLMFPPTPPELAADSGTETPGSPPSTAGVKELPSPTPAPSTNPFGVDAAPKAEPSKDRPDPPPAAVADEKSAPPPVLNPRMAAKPEAVEPRPAATYAAPSLPPGAGDDRYSPVAGAPLDPTRPMPSAPTIANRQAPGESSSMVVQVSGGDSSEPTPQSTGRTAAPVAAEQPAPAALPAAPALDPVPGPSAATDPVAPSAGAPAGRPAAVLNPYAVPASRYGQEPVEPAPAGYIPGGAPQPGVAPAAATMSSPIRNDGSYEVQPNDSYWTICEKVYGSGAYFRALAEHNRGRAARPDRLSPGLVIGTPPVAQLQKDYPDLCPRPNHRDAIRNRQASAGAASPVSYGGGRTYVVQEGDTLSSIARNELGKVSRWAEIYQLNRAALGKDYDYLTPGMRLALPPRESRESDRTTRRSDSGMPFMR